MNYRLRDAVLGLLAPSTSTRRASPTAGTQLAPSEFAARLASIREDYADAAYYSLMNLLDSHDTERLLWTLTPGAETTGGEGAERGQRRRRASSGCELASLIQFTVPGAPTVYYGDEVGVTGDDDPDDRRTYPWADLGGSPDNSLRAHYAALAALRRGHACAHGRRLPRSAGRRRGADGARTAARPQAQAAVVAINRSASTAHARTSRSPAIVPTGDLLDRVRGRRRRRPSRPSRRRARPDAAAARRGRLCRAPAGLDLTPPAAPAGLHVTGEGDGQVVARMERRRRRGRLQRLPQPALAAAAGCKANGAAVTGTSFTDTGLANAQTALLRRPRARRGRQRERALERGQRRCRTCTIGWANLQWPPTLTHTISAVDRTDNVYGQVWIDGETSKPGATPSLRAQLGFGPDGSQSGRQRRLDVGRRAPSTPTRATTTSSSRACCPRRRARSTTSTATRRRTAATGSTPTWTGSATATAPPRPGEPDGERRAATRRRPRCRPACTSSRPRPHGDRARPGTPWPATRRCTATRCGAATRPAAPTRRSRSSPATSYTDDDRGRGRRPTTTSSARSTRRSTARATRTRCTATAELRTVHADVQRHAVRADRRHGQVRLHRRLPRPPRRRPAAVGPGRRRADEGGRHPLDDLADRQGRDAARVQVRARLVGLRREGRQRAARSATGC